MTSQPPDDCRNQRILHAAFRLHTRAPMRFTLACAALLASAFVAASASAQTTTTTSNGTGSCTGTLAGTVGLSVEQDGSLQSIQAAALGTVFGNAECECSPTDTTQQINLEIKLTTALPTGSVGTAE